ncbi:hypothetical protein SLEP1_g32590 [Rubroshorea leprosula]|uniref:Uncharacterized protein n=1 Tax=Rubroshorea leprosula TaxID=152421 RepID=A0AAV5KE00_9ROSI|nr:hypothetical protein SLEP1_g32590 [Rubroshorea leprosula]
MVSESLSEDCYIHKEKNSDKENMNIEFLAEGAIQPLYVHCCGTSAPLPKSRANQPLHLTKPANQPFC